MGNLLVVGLLCRLINVQPSDFSGGNEPNDEQPRNSNKKRKSTVYTTDCDVEGRRIGKLFVSNREIAQASDGPVMYEGSYEAPVVVKSLLKADVAFEEIEKLLTDRHPNIVRLCTVDSLLG